MKKDDRLVRVLHSMASLFCRCAVAIAVSLLPPSLLFANHNPSGQPIGIVDAHSQVDDQIINLADVIGLMNQAGVVRTILAARGQLQPTDLLNFAALYPGRITSAMRSKGGDYSANLPGYYQLLIEQIILQDFTAMGEVLMYHAEKFKNGQSIADEVVVYPDDERVQTALAIALWKGWPFVIHIEFAAAGTLRTTFMQQMEAMLYAHPNHPFALIHMGQLRPRDVRRLINAHPNLVFLTSHTTPLSTVNSGQPWTNMFKGPSPSGAYRLASNWKQLIVNHPRRFVMAFDNVHAVHWGPFYLNQVGIWRQALAELPSDVAHAIAFGNAIRLWSLP